MSTFVSQVGGEPGSSDMWLQPWVVITVHENLTQEEFIKILGSADEAAFYDLTTYTINLNNLRVFLMDEGLTGIHLQTAEAVHFAVE